jgi:sugar phosphate isomerase/epimerase
MDSHFSRRDFLQKSLIAGLGLMAADPLSAMIKTSAKGPKFGLVTYLWGKDWDLPTLIKNCEEAGYQGVELRTEHAHGVEIALNAAQRAEVKKRFADSKVTCLGYGSNFEYQSPNPAELKKNIDQTKEYIKLCKDIGASGIKIKPNTFPKEVAREQTIAQIASLLMKSGNTPKTTDNWFAWKFMELSLRKFPILKPSLIR